VLADEVVAVTSDGTAKALPAGSTGSVRANEVAVTPVGVRPACRAPPGGADLLVGRAAIAEEAGALVTIALAAVGAIGWLVAAA